jgi:DNA replication protein DnaC
MKELDSQLETCEKCGEPIQKIVELLGVKRRVPIMCRCKKKELKDKEIKDLNLEKQERLKSLIKNSLMEKSFFEKTFENWDFNKGQKTMYNLGIKYANNFKKIKQEGLGLLVYGNPGNGKSYLSFAIANELLKKQQPVICISINGLLERIRETYSRWGREGETEILKSLGNADLLVIDDLGVEQSTDWSVTKIYNIIDSRYRNKLPLIVTTNHTLDDLKELYGERTYDRLIEMCTPIQNNGQSIRKEKAKDNTKILKEILG